MRNLGEKWRGRRGGAILRSERQVFLKLTYDSILLFETCVVLERCENALNLFRIQISKAPDQSTYAS